MFSLRSKPQVSGEGGLFEISDHEFGLFRDLIYRETGITLKEVKRSLVVSRLGKRLRALGLSSFGEYYSVIKLGDASGDELRRMINCITTNKTSFFREAQHFDFLKERLVEMARCEMTGSLRIWSCACSSGEEPYTLSITASQALAARPGWDVRILATDIDTDILAKAKAGIYEAESIDTLDRALVRRYFLRGKGHSEGLVMVKPEVRKMVVFERLNLIEDSWPIRDRFDVIFCRNVIIYFDRETQKRLFERLVRHLKPDGLLFVGHSESLYWMSDVLEPVQHTIYRIRGHGGHR